MLADCYAFVKVYHGFFDPVILSPIKTNRMHFITAQWKLGALLALHTIYGLRAILLGSSPSTLVREAKLKFPNAKPAPAGSALHRSILQLVAYAETPAFSYMGPLEIKGTSFQQAVWRIIRTIPLGETITYSELAARVGRPKACRAVANACSANPLALIIPCHRVVGRHNLGGYHWGLPIKQALLKQEAHLSQLAFNERKKQN